MIHWEKASEICIEEKDATNSTDDETQVTCPKCLEEISIIKSHDDIFVKHGIHNSECTCHGCIAKKEN